MAYDEGLLARCLDAVGELDARGVTHKNAFGMRGLMLGKRMFAAVGEDSMLVKLTPEAYERARADGVDPFAPGGSGQMGTWVQLPAEVVADDPELRDWLAAGLAAVR